jgi:hypothetical protein
MVGTLLNLPRFKILLEGLMQSYRSYVAAAGVKAERCVFGEI